MKKLYSKKIVILIIVIFVIAGFNSWYIINYFQQESPSGIEIQEILTIDNLNLREQAYQRLIERVGPVAAQEELYTSGLVFDGQAHLLNHTVGKYLYKEIGNEGIIQCKDYFLSSCFHGFLIPLIAEKGVKELDDVMMLCWKRSLPIAIQCAHGIGHGLLVSAGYNNLPKALEQCDRLSETSNDFPEFHCFDGVFMENIWAVHENGRPSPDRWVKKEDPVYPCNDARIAEEYRKACWANQPDVLFSILRKTIEDVSEVCSSLQNENYKEMCFDGIARKIQPMSEGSSEKVIQFCKRVSSEWEDDCIISNVRSYFSLGDRVIPFDLCNRIYSDAKKRCYNEIIKSIGLYFPVSSSVKDALCSQVPAGFNEEKKCQKENNYLFL